MKKKWSELAKDEYDLFNKAYDARRNGSPGYWLGHVDRYNGLREGLLNMISKANALGCPIPQDAYDMLHKKPPKSPLK